MAIKICQTYDGDHLETLPQFKAGLSTIQSEQQPRAPELQGPQKLQAYWVSTG